MNNNVVRFPIQNVQPPSVDKLVERIRILAAPNAARNSVRQGPNFQNCLLRRGLSMREVLETVRKGCALGTPEMNQRGDWRLKLKRKVAGRRIQVVVAYQEDHILLEMAN